MYRVSIGYLSDIYRASIGKSRPMTDLCVASAWSLRGLRTASRKTHILSDYYFCLAVLFLHFFEPF